MFKRNLNMQTSPSLKASRVSIKNTKNKQKNKVQSLGNGLKVLGAHLTVSQNL